ncbi:MAG: FUN14 domain-containing protein [Gammaproteobacteria bacterium]
MNNNVFEKAFASDMFSSNFLLGNVGAPFVIGLAVGYFAKKMLGITLFLSGAAIVSMFAGEYYGFFEITDEQLQSAANSATQTAKDTGGFLIERLSTITTRGVSGAAGFFAGFKLG